MKQIKHCTGDDAVGFHLSVHLDFTLLDSLVSSQALRITECKLHVECGKL